MIEKGIKSCLEALKRRILPDGGFSAHQDGAYRPDATAWAILAFKAAGVQSETIDRARSRLRMSQLTDGRVCLSPDHPEVIWPTPLAILAWQGSEPHRRPNYWP